MEQGDNAADEKAQGPKVADIPVELPKAPNPSADPGVIPDIKSPAFDKVKDIPPDEDFDVDTLEPLFALKLLAEGVGGLVEITGDIPPTPPVTFATSINHPGILNRLSVDSTRPPNLRPKTPPSNVPPDDIKSPEFLSVHIGSPEAHASEEPLLDAERRTMYNSISRKFFSKKPPPISIDDYLLRLHRYCPMSTAVYLAAGAYIRKIALDEKAMPVTLRSVHRLLLASLRVAMKALEDLSYPHQRFAGVGGVSEKELAKLEINMCYLTNFELRVTSKILCDTAKALQQLKKGNVASATANKLNLPTRPRRTTVA